METTNFHYEDIPPQIWLDNLHQYNIPSIWDVQLDNIQRTNLSNRASDNLKEWRTNLREQMKNIQSRYDSSKKDKMRNMLAPYQLLDNLGSDLNSQLRDLKTRLSAGRAIPEGFAIGERIFGDLATRRWHFGEPEDERLWKDFLSTEKRYKTLRKEYKQQVMGLKNAAQRVKEQKKDLIQIEANYKARSGFLQIGLRLFIVLLSVVLSLAIGIVTFIYGLPFESPAPDTSIAVIFVCISVIGAVMAVVLMRRRRQSLVILEEDIATMKLNLQNTKQDARRQKQLFFPTEDTFKEIYEDYKIMKKAFE